MWLKTNMTFADHKQRFFDDDDDDLIHVEKTTQFDHSTSISRLF